MSDTRAELLIREEADGWWQVWIGEHGEHPVNSPLGFVIATGYSRNEALSNAVACLEASVEALQSPPGVVPHERENSEGDYDAVETAS